ncbi:MAG: hypothetical protein ACPL1G_08765 [Thermodesulfovibrionales bacterium]
METYCNQLGMIVNLSYCVIVNEGLPCRNIVPCWEKRMDIIKFLNEKFTEKEIKKVFGGLPKSKLERIIESLKDISDESSKE